MHRGSAKARRWFDLELRLLLLGAEERGRPGLRAFRDPARPRVWDRQMVIAEAPPERPMRDLHQLDLFYRECGMEQWSLVSLADGVGRAWEEALVPRGLAGERVRLMSRSPRPFPVRSDLLRLEGAAGFARLTRLLEAVTEAAGGGVAAQVLEVVAARRHHRFPCRALAIEEDGEIVASITLTGARERVWLEDLMVLPSHRRRGLGRELFRAAETEARRLRARSVGFSASAADWPSAWYERDGFGVDGEVVRLRRVL